MMSVIGVVPPVTGFVSFAVNMEVLRERLGIWSS